MKILSFIIPSYNCSRYLDKCITSFLDENILDQLDIIIVNDGSTDDTAEVAGRYCEMYPQSVRLISQQNKGHGGALNTGCAAAVGKYLKVIDADDWVQTENLPRFMKLLEDCDSDVVLTHHDTIHIGTGEIKNWKSYPEAFGKSYSLEQIMANWGSFSRSMTFHGITYNTAFYRRNGIQLSEHVFYEDYEYATIPCCYAKTVTPLDLLIYHYRIGDVQQSVSDANQIKRIGHTETVLNRLIQEFRQMPLPPEAAGREYVCMKSKELLLRYITTALLVVKDRKSGKRMGVQMMAHFKQEMPRVYELAHGKYQVFRLLNLLHVNKETWERILNSKIYHMLKRDNDFN